MCLKVDHILWRLFCGFSLCINPQLFMEFPDEQMALLDAKVAANAQIRRTTAASLTTGDLVPRWFMVFSCC